MTIDALAKKIFAECEKEGEPVTMDEAREMAEMEMKATGTTIHETKAGNKTKNRPRKVDETKKHLLACIKVLLEGLGATETTLNNEVELTFNYETDNYSIRLIKHRKEKGKKND